MTEAQALVMLTAAYQAQVRSRRREYIADEPTLSALARVARWLTAEDGRPGLMLYGGPGSGKTTMALSVTESCRALRGAFGEMLRNRLALTREREAELERLQAAVRVPVFTTAQELAALLSSSDPRYQVMRSRSFLVIDDIGTEPSARGWGAAADVLRARYDSLLPTVVTTNLTDAQFAERYGSQLADRVAEFFDRIGYTHGSYRRL